MDKEKYFYSEFVSECKACILKNTNNKVNENQTLGFDYEIFKKVLSMYEKSGRTFESLMEEDPKPILKFISNINLKDLSFVDTCFAGNIKSVYNNSENKEKFLSNIRSILLDIKQSNKFKKLFDKTKQDNLELESDLQMIASIFAELNQSTKKVEEVIESKINFIVSFIEKVITKENYLSRFAMLVSPKTDISEENIKKINENFSLTVEQAHEFLDMIHDWDAPQANKQNIRLKEVTKKVFKRSNTFRTYTQKASENENRVAMIKFKITSFLTLLLQYCEEDSTKDFLKDLLTNLKSILSKYTKINFASEFKIEDVKKIADVLHSTLKKDKEKIFQEFMQSNDNKNKIRSMYDNFCDRFNIPYKDENYEVMVEKINLLFNF